MGRSYKYLNLELEVHSPLTQAQGQIRLEPGSLTTLKTLYNEKETK